MILINSVPLTYCTCLLFTFLDLTSCQKCITNIHNVMLLLYIHFSTHLFIYYFAISVVRSFTQYNICYVMFINHEWLIRDWAPKHKSHNLQETCCAKLKADSDRAHTVIA